MKGRREEKAEGIEETREIKTRAGTRQQEKEQEVFERAEFLRAFFFEGGF
jgi:hypothetical protein